MKFAAASSDAFFVASPQPQKKKHWTKIGCDADKRKSYKWYTKKRERPRDRENLYNDWNLNGSWFGRFFQKNKMKSKCFIMLAVFFSFSRSTWVLLSKEGCARYFMYNIVYYSAALFFNVPSPWYIYSAFAKIEKINKMKFRKKKTSPTDTRLNSFTRPVCVLCPPLPARALNRRKWNFSSNSPPNVCLCVFFLLLLLFLVATRTNYLRWNSSRTSSIDRKRGGGGLSLQIYGNSTRCQCSNILSCQFDPKT